MSTSHSDQIITTPGTYDPIWGEFGEVLYSKTNDRLFGVPGKWDIRYNADLELAWIDPRPTTQSLNFLYKNYLYTHQDNEIKASSNVYGRLIRNIYKLTIGRHPLYKSRIELDHMFLENGNGRSLLDVGCGNGSRMKLLQDRGWITTGVEFDPEAIKFARSKYDGINIHQGSLESACFGSQKFDAIILNHVIEHLPFPCQTIKLCREILSNKGKLVIVTPNIKSFGHQLFKKYYYHLDPPRHLQLFSVKSLQRLIQEVGFKNYEISTTALRAEMVGHCSAMFKYGILNDKISPSRIIRDFNSLRYQYCALKHIKSNPQSGDEIILNAFIN